MKSNLKSLSRKLQKKRRALLRQYEEEDLHQLRIALRRMRSLLKNKPGKKARHLRHELGKLADATNAARDWDTLLARAHSNPGGRNIALLKECLEERQANAHHLALRMLETDSWPDTLNRWDKYLQKHPPDDTPRGNGKSLPKAKERVILAWMRANSVDDVRNWHKLRIAIKELRYRLDEVPKELRDAYSTRVLRQCKRLQTHLGDWHDTIVHRQMVQDLIHALHPKLDNQVLELLLTWCQQMEVEGRHCLERTKSDLESTEAENPIGAFEIKQ